MTTLLIASCAFAAALSPTRSTLLPAMSSFVGDIPIKAPAGWKSDKQDGATVITPPDVPSGKVYSVVVTPMQTKAGTLDEVYEVAKKMIGEVGTYKAAADPQLGSTRGGWDYKFSVGAVEKNGGAFLAEVVGLKKGDAGGVIIVVADSLATMQTYAEVCATMIRDIGYTAETSPTAEAGSDTGVVDLQYAVPAGWVESKIAGLPALTKEKKDFYFDYHVTFVICPTETLKGSLKDSFLSHWKQLIAPNYTLKVAPLPLMERLDSGYALAFDGDLNAKNKNGANTNANLYLLCHGGKVVPILGIFNGDYPDMDKDLDKFFLGLRIGSAGTTKVKLFNSADFVGDWAESSSSYASYVTVGGAYAGDASVMTSTTLNLRADGTFRHHFKGLSRAGGIDQDVTGKWSIEDNELVLAGPNETKRYPLLGAGPDPKLGRFLVMGQGSGGVAHLSFKDPRGQFRASWLVAK